jgi:isoquinoline 1-oxidoreductase subunit beta
MAFSAARIAAGGRSGQGGVDPRGGHPARYLSAGLSRHPDRHLEGRRPHRRLEAQGHRLGGDGALRARVLPKGVDIDGVDSAADALRHSEPARGVQSGRAAGRVTGFWRGVGPNNNVFAIESFIDELAKQAGRDPIAFRRAHLDKTPRLQAALDLVREKSGWGSALGPRAGRGVAAQISFASFIATVVECEVDEYGEIKLRRVTSAVDTGTVINPDTVIAQLQGD